MATVHGFKLSGGVASLPVSILPPFSDTVTLKATILPFFWRNKLLPIGVDPHSLHPDSLMKRVSDIANYDKFSSRFHNEHLNVRMMFVQMQCNDLK